MSLNNPPMSLQADAPPHKLPGEILRHKLSVRISHWLNSAAFIVLLVSGIGIVLAHPQFYWGETGYFGMEPWLKLWFEPDLTHTSWGRNLHFLFAWVFVVNGAIYILTGLLSGHFQQKILPTWQQLRPTNVLAELSARLRLRRHNAQELENYNLLQKFTYLVVIFVLCPLMLLSGLAMSPGFVTALPELTDLFGGRQSGRSIHFICASLLALFLVIHLIEVALAGAGKLLRSMITGSLKRQRNDNE